MMDETNPVEPEVEAAPEEEVLETYETEDSEQELDEDGNPLEEPDETVELDVNGKKFKVPKELKDGFLMQADYTRKTQELAEQRRAVEAELQAAKEVSEGEFRARAQIAQIDEAIAEYKTVDWDRWMQSNPQEAQRAWMQYQRLNDERGTAVQNYQQLQQQRTLLEHRQAEERKEKGLAELQAKIPDWSENKAKALLDFGVKQLGFSAQELMAIDDPRMIIALNLAAQGQQKQTAQKAAAKVEAQSSIRPAARVTGGRTATGNKLDDRASTDAWMKARMAQVTKG